MALTPEQEREYIAQLDKLSVTQIRSDLDNGKIPLAYVHVASTWLSDKEREAERQREVSQSEQMDLMRRQAKAAERANTWSTIAIIIATVSLIVSIFSPFKH